jgi:hypothetical protein
MSTNSSLSFSLDIENLKSRVASSGMLHRVALVRTDVSEESSASFIMVTRTGELGTTLAVTSHVIPSSPILIHSDEGVARFLLNVGSYKSHMASHSKRRLSS